MRQLTSQLDTGRITLDETTFNRVASAQMQTLFSDSLGQVMLTDIRVYDRYKNEPVTYVSFIGYLDNNIFVQDDDVIAQIKSICVALINSVYPPSEVVIRFQFVYSNNGTRTIKNFVVDERKPK